MTLTANTKTAFDFFVSNGYSDTQAAGIIGNLMYESAGASGDINPTSEENGGGGGVRDCSVYRGGAGLVLRTWVTAQGEDPTSLTGQLDYLLYDLNTNYPTVVSAM